MPLFKKNKNTTKSAKNVSFSSSSLMVGMLFILFLVPGCDPTEFEDPKFNKEKTEQDSSSKESTTTNTPKSDGWKTLQGGLKYKDLKVGSGRELKAKEGADVHYFGYLTDGTKFDSSYDRGTPFTLNNRVGTSGGWSVIEGWKMGIPGMKEGGKRKLIVPAELGYGGRQQGNIPPNSTLVFEVELIRVKK